MPRENVWGNEGWAQRTAQHMLVQISGISLQRKVMSGGRARMDEVRMVKRRRIVVDMQDIVVSLVVIGAMRYQDRYDGGDVCGGCRRCEDIMARTRVACLAGLFLLNLPSTRVSRREVTLCRWKGMTILCLVISGKEMLSSTFHSRYTYGTQH